MNPATIICIAIAGVSIWGFQNSGLVEKLIMSPYRVLRYKEWYRVVSHSFIHANWMHLLFNLLALWSFGGTVIQYLLTPYPDLHFYLLYFLGVIIAAVPDILKHKNNSYYLSLGASGGVSAVVFSAIFFDPWSMILVFFIPCPGIIFGVLYLIYSSYMSKKGGDHINHDAHIYGAVFGFLYPILIRPDSVNIFIQQLLHPSFL